MITLLRPVLILFAALTLVTGVIYPLAVTGIGAWLFPAQVNGSLVTRDGRMVARGGGAAAHDGAPATQGAAAAARDSQVVGSLLISQSFQDPKYFWGRLSATAPMPNNGAASGGSNLGPLNPALVEAASARIAALRAADPGNEAPIPVDLVTASGSGLDPQISPAAALYQVMRVARERGQNSARVAALVRAHIEAPQWGLFGEPRVNVLMLNLALDRAQ